MDISLAALKAGEFGIFEFIVSVLFSMAAGVVCMVMYRIYFTRVLDRNESLARSLVLIAPGVSAIFWAIQYSLPLSLGLLGALSFVRFRTPVKKAEDIGFILLIIAVSLLSSVYRFFAAGSLLVIVASAVMVKAFFIDKKIGFFRLGVPVTLFITTKKNDFPRVDGQIREILLNSFSALLPKNLILADVVSKDESYSLRYSAYFKKCEESLIAKLVAKIDGLENVKRVEAFREKITS